ncbi:MAG TPA: CHAD domain-containing protein [Candidatus Dormibacteraeota bacterium]|nr:CHAD domain-containing protein [Candidatus Dormibacteraeota bacterium]
MADVTTIPSRARSEHRGLIFWMNRVLKQAKEIRSSSEPDLVHDLRVAIRRCRSLAAVMAEVDPDPAWPEMRKVGHKLFRKLGDLRDGQVLDEWIAKLGPEGNPLREQLHDSFKAEEPKLHDAVVRVAERFDEKSWKRLARRLRQRSSLVPAGSLAAECLALERFQEAKELHACALRTERSKTWHALRIGLKRFRYTVEGLLPEHYAAWHKNLKRVQDLLGDIHDLDVLTETIKDAETADTHAFSKVLKEKIQKERHERIQTYRHLTLGKTGLWNEWRLALPHNDRLEAAAMARLRATARASDPHPRRTAQVARLALRVFDLLRRVAMKATSRANAFGATDMPRSARIAHAAPMAKLAHAGTAAKRAHFTKVVGASGAVGMSGVGKVCDPRVGYAVRAADAAAAAKMAKIVFSEPKNRVILEAAARLHEATPKQTKKHQKAARQFLLSLPVPPGWTRDQWELLAWIVRYHRGSEPKTSSGAFSRLTEEQQHNICALAGVLRLARALRKAGIQSPTGFRMEETAEAIILHLPGLTDSEEIAARLAAGKHLLETELQKPLLVKPAPQSPNLVTLPAKQEELTQFSVAASD